MLPAFLRLMVNDGNDITSAASIKSHSSTPFALGCSSSREVRKLRSVQKVLTYLTVQPSHSLFAKCLKYTNSFQLAESFTKEDVTFITIWVSDVLVCNLYHILGYIVIQKRQPSLLQNMFICYLLLSFGGNVIAALTTFTGLHFFSNRQISTCRAGTCAWTWLTTFQPQMVLI